MGTNYYLHKNVCAHCGRGDEPLHIGKSSAGWCFGLHIIPEHGIRDLPDWEREWSTGVIKDEYDRVVTPEEMRNIITNRGSEDSTKWEKEWWHGYGSEAGFHASNESERGPRGMLRARIGRFCSGHGAGTWDLFEREFS